MSIDLETGLLDHPARRFSVSCGPLPDLKADLRLGLSFLGTLQTNDERNVHVELLRGVDDTLSDVVAPHDATEDIDKDALDLGVRSEDLESLFDSFGSSTSANELNNWQRRIITSCSPSDVKEVGGIATMERQDVHGSHSKTSAVDQAPDAAVKLDKVQVGFLGLDF